MAKEQRVVFIIFGGSGDLAHRKLYPALFKLYLKGYLHHHFAVIGTARRPWSHEYFRQTVMESIGEDIGDQEKISSFAQHFYYQSHDVNDAAHYLALKKLAAKLSQQYQSHGNQIFYMAIAPRFFGVVAQHLHAENLLTTTGYNRIIIEKPFGRDVQSATTLNAGIAAAFSEKQIYRVDHYLGKEVVQSLPLLRFTNPLLEAVWNHHYISNIQITLAETLGVGERAGYYETAGALRDMIQNHALQILGLLAMEKPAEFSSQAIHQQKEQLFAQLPQYSPSQIEQNFVRGQYDTDKKGNQLAYRQADNVANDSSIETFVAGKILINNSRWQGVPFYVRSGKRLRQKSTRIDIVFKNNNSKIFTPSQLQTSTVQPVILSICVEPVQGLSLTLNGTNPGRGLKPFAHTLKFQQSLEEMNNSQEAYEKLLIDIIQGDQTNFTTWNEQKLTWGFIDRIREYWDHTRPQFPNYLSSTFGPQQSAALLAQDHHKWVWGSEE